MAFRLVTGFGHLATGSHSVGSEGFLVNFATHQDQSINVGLFSSQTYGRRCFLDFAAATAADTSVLITKALGGLGTAVIGARFFIVTAGATNLMRFMSGGDALGYLMRQADGTLAYYTAASGGSVVATSSTTVPLNQWVFVEVTITFGNTTAGSVAFHIEGQAAGSTSSIDTIGAGTTLTSIQFGYNSASGPDWNSATGLTDFYVDDSTRRGPLEPWYRAGAAAGAAAAFTPNSGTNHAAVDDVGEDGDSTYVESLVAGSLDQIALTGSLPGSPLAVQPIAIARYTGTGSASLKLGVKSGATHSQGSSQGLTASYAGYAGTIHVVDPNTGIAWTAGNADAAQVSYEHT